MYRNFLIVFATSAVCASSAVLLAAEAAFGAKSTEPADIARAQKFRPSELQFSDANLVNSDELRKKRQANPGVVARMSALKQTSPLKEMTHTPPHGVNAIP